MSWTQQRDFSDVSPGKDGHCVEAAQQQRLPGEKRLENNQNQILISNFIFHQLGLSAQTKTEF